MNWAVLATIAAWCANIAKSIGFWFKELFSWLFDGITSTWGIILIIGSCAYVAVLDINLTLASLLQLIGAINTPSGVSLSPPGGFAYWLAVANTFSPLTELFGYLNIYLHLVVGWGCVKLVKSYSVVAQGGGA